MELQSQQNGGCNQYFCNKEYDTNDGNNTWVSDFETLPQTMDGNFCNFWMHSYSGSYATDARMRLESLMSGSSSPVPTGAKMELMYNYDFSKDIWQIGQNELSALDSVDLIDVEGDEEDEESWLYVLPKDCAFVEKTESALRWCRHVLDNRSPEMETACLKLINRLNLKLSCESKHSRLQQTFFHEIPMDHAFFSSTFSSGSFDQSDSNYTFQNISDIYDIARIQEASLRQDNVFTHRRLESPQTLCSKPTATSDVTKGNGAEALCSQSARSVEKTCLSPKVTRLHQYKMLRRAQNQGSSSRSSSPMRTSLRSLQAVRSSRSLDIDDNSLDQILLPSPDELERMTSVNRSSSFRSSSRHRPASDEPVQSTAIRRCQRSHSLSPCRIPHPAHTSSIDRNLSSLIKINGAVTPRSGRRLQI